MRKLLPLILLTVFFMACSSDDDNADPNKGNNGNQNNSGMIDKNILGKWKVEYSKTIKGARYLEDGTLEIADNAVITEYDGDIASSINSYIFRDWERVVEFTKDNKLLVYDIGDKGVFVDRDNSAAKYSVYEIKDNTIEWSNSRGQITIIPRIYSLKNGELTIEVKPSPLTEYIYITSKYSMITE